MVLGFGFFEQIYPMGEDLLEDTNYDKGIKLERDFAQFMKSKLNWQGVKIRANVKAHNNAKGSNIDIIAVGLDARGIQLNKMSLFYLAISLIMFILWIYCLLIETDVGLFFLAMSIFTCLLFFGCIYLSRKYNSIHAWVECKSHTKRVEIDLISTMLYRHHQYKISGDRQYKFEVLIFVSKSGFTENALKEALNNGVHCYTVEDGNFKKITSWWD